MTIVIESNPMCTSLPEQLAEMNTDLCVCMEIWICTTWYWDRVDMFGSFHHVLMDFNSISPHYYDLFIGIIAEW